MHTKNITQYYKSAHTNVIYLFFFFLFFRLLFFFLLFFLFLIFFLIVLRGKQGSV